MVITLILVNIVRRWEIEGYLLFIRVFCAFSEGFDVQQSVEDRSYPGFKCSLEQSFLPGLSASSKTSSRRTFSLLM